MGQAYQVIDKGAPETTGGISLTKTLNTHSSKSEITVRLIEQILNLPANTQRNLLKDLENENTKISKKHQKKLKNHAKELRKHPRKTSLIATDCSTNDVSFINFIKDISNGGVFIESNAPFYIGQEIKMNFSLPEVKDTIAVGGKVVRVNSHGIGVKFINGDINKLDIKV